MEEFLRLQRLELLQQGVPDSNSDRPDMGQKQQPVDEMVFMNDQEDDDLEEANLAFITSILESFSHSESRSMRHTSRRKQSHDDPFYAEFPPEGALTREDAKQ
jgi:hypothetical protein